MWLQALSCQYPIQRILLVWSRHVAVPLLFDSRVYGGPNDERKPGVIIPSLCAIALFASYLCYTAIGAYF